MKIKSLLLLCASILTLASCGGNPTPSDEDDKPGDEEKVESTKTEVKFSDVFNNSATDIVLSNLTEPVTYEGIKFSFKKNSGQNDPIYHSQDKQARLYLNNTMTLSLKGMTRVDFLFSGDKNGTITADKGTYVAGGSTTGKWTGEASNELTFTIATGQRRTISLTVYTGDYEDEEKIEYPEDTANSYTVDIEHLGITNSIPEAQGNFKELMMSYFGKQRSELSDVSTTGKAQIFHKAQEYNNKVYEVLALQVASSENDGSFTLKFSKPLKSVKLYSSPNFAFQRNNQTGEFYPKCDKNCAIAINGQNWELGSLDEDNFEIKRSDKEFTVNSDTLTISGTANHRVFTYAMTFTF